MGFFTMLLIWAALFVLGELLRPKPKFGGQKPGDVTPPTAEEGIPIAVIFGTVKISPNVTWFGDVFFTRLTKKVRTGLFSSTRVTTGYEYGAGMMLSLCHGPVDEVLEIWFADYALSKAPLDFEAGTYWGAYAAPIPLITPGFPLQQTAGGTVTQIYAPDMFGGKEREGGVRGQMDFYFGTVTNEPNPYLSLFWGADLTSHYRRLCYAVVRRMVLGTSPYIKPMWFVLRRTPQQVLLNGNILGDSNPAEIIYEILTDKLWGIGMSPDKIDMGSFANVGSTLATEAFGLAFVFKQKISGEEAIREVLRHIDGVMYSNPVGGKITLKLIREDYVVANLLRIDPQNSWDVEYRRGSWAETFNEIKVTYTDRSRNFQDAVAQAQNLASVQAMEEVVTKDENLPGITRPELAQYVTERLLRAASLPLAKASFKVNRQASFLTIGDPFVLNWPDKGIDELVMRVVKIDYGKLDDGAVEIEAVADVFDLSGVAYGIPDNDSGSLICGPLNFVAGGYGGQFEIGEQEAFEAPYFHSGGARRVYAVVSRRAAADGSWEAWVSANGATYALQGAYTIFTPVGRTVSELGYSVQQDEVGFTVVDMHDMDTLTGTDAAGLAAGARLAKIGNEIIAWRSIVALGGGQYTISGILRGQLDTVPEKHLSGKPVFFYHPGKYASVASPATNMLVQAKALRIDADGAEPLDSAETMSVSVTGRALAPAPPGNVRLNGSDYNSWPATIVGDAVLSWSHRNRTQKANQDDITDYTLEGTLTIEGVVSGQVKRTWSGVTANSVTWIAGDIASDNPNGDPMRFRIIPVGTYTGIARLTPSFT